MSKMTKVVLCVTLTLLFLGAYFVVSAAETHEAGPPRDISSLRFPPPVNEVSKSTFFTTASPYAALVAGFNTEDSGAKFTCTSGSGTCTLVVNSFATSSGGGLASDDRLSAWSWTESLPAPAPTTATMRLTAPTRP